jgi:CHAT domain-containing protein
VRGGLLLPRLPSTRIEVDAIARLYPGVTQAYLGNDATEERAKSVGTDARYLHFACHGILDGQFPLDSALALTVPERPAEGQDNGLLQAWEIYERVRIDADLVTLSACETALGKQMGGEGLIGLTRAFQYAGARSILASLWAVSDESTADLMRRFYTHLKAGETKDEALRDAQLELIRGGKYAHPYHWAAFEIIGDWR